LKNNVFSGPAYGSLQGTVRDERIARPLKLTVVEISDLAGAVVNTATTDDSGHYLIESLKTGNYVVKFTAPLHKIESKTIKIEKDLASTISVDLAPDEQRMRAALNVPETSVRQNIPAPYGASGTQSQMPVTSQYGAAQNIPQDYSKIPQTADAPTYGAQNPGYRRHSRRSYSGASVDSSSGTSQSTSQGSDLAGTGAQLLQALLSKKSENSSSAATTN